MSRKRLTPIALALGLTALAFAAESGGPSGPVSGAVFDRSSRSIRPILGIPGSSYLGPDAAAGLDEAAVAPNGSLALALSAGRLVLVRGLERLSPVSVDIEGALADAGRIAWSPDSSAAVLYSPASRRIQVIRNVEKSPVAGSATELAAAGRLSSLAVDASGNVLAGVEGAGLFLHAAGQPARLLAPFGNVTSLLLTRGGADVFVVDREKGLIAEIRDFLTSAAVMPFTDGLLDPAGIALSRDKRQMFVATAGEDRKSVV